MCKYFLRKENNCGERNFKKKLVQVKLSDNKMDKTIVVAVEDNVKHPLYNKIVNENIQVKGSR